MNDELRHRILSLNPLKPFVWRLKLTEQEYHQLEEEVKGFPQHLTRDDAILVVAYLAEWYKRDYDGNVQNPLNNYSAEYIWKTSGINSEVYLYHSRKTARYLESIFMLGGMPMRFLLQRSDKRVLKALCTLYKDKDAIISDTLSIGKGMALAFQESIHQYGSLYYFMDAMLHNQSTAVYAEEDLNDKTSLPCQFIDAINKAYDDVMRDKFRIEWVIEQDPASPFMRRMIRLWLRPEELGGFHQYLRFERANTWQIPELMRQRNLRVSLVFKMAGEVVGGKESCKEIITFENTGQEDTGFEATGSVPWGIQKSIPTQPFDKICVVVTTDDGHRYEVQTVLEKQPKYMQLWSMPDEINRWSSIRNDQNDTAVVYSDYYMLDGVEHISKSFYDKAFGISQAWNFAFIDDHVTLHHQGEPDVTLWKRDGYIQFAPVLYTSVIRYKAGKVRCLINEDPEIYPEPEMEVWYPVIFRRQDIKAMHFASRDVLNSVPDEQDIQKIEYKLFDAPNTEEYTEWTPEATPPYGRLKLRLTIKDDQKVYPILYLPSMLEHGETQPVIRDFDNNILKYINPEGRVVEEKIDIPLDKHPLGVTQPVTVWGNEIEKAELDVIQPTLVKEVYLDGKVVKYLHEEDEFILPYLLRNRIVIHDFNRKGYSEYECFNVGDLDEKGSLQKWKLGGRIKTTNIIADIPAYIRLAYGLPENMGHISKMLYWKYDSDKQPEEVDSDFGDMAPGSILFQDMRLVDDDLDCIPPKTNNESADEWDWDDFDSETSDETQENDVLLLRCYDIATEYKTYYFIFNPLFNITEEQFVREICVPLKDRRHEQLTQEDIQNLMRCASECGVKWENINDKF